jgi:hypothetical protein
MNDEAVESGSKPDPNEQIEIQRRINDAAIKARLIILINGLREAFNIVNLTDPDQQRRAALLEQFTTEYVLVNDDAGGITLQKAMQLVAKQHEHYLAYPGAENIRFALQKFFEMAHEKTGRPIDPKIPVDSRTDPLDKQVMPRWREWRQGFS